MLLLPTLLTACLVNQDLYERRHRELSEAEIETDSDGDGDGFLASEDCDDGDAGVHPGAIETCDGADEDCDEATDEDASDAVDWYADADGDGFGDRAVTSAACSAPSGFVSDDSDCRDDDADVHPTAVESWYDGVDQDCDGADDYDADADGDPSDDFGGTDCNDIDATIHGGAREGWGDGGVDNNCDGSLDDQAVADIDELATTIAGVTAGGAFGSSVLVVPTGWIDDEAVILASAPFAGTGDLYGWRASALSGVPALGTATWHLSGAQEDDFLGFGLAWTGSAEAPVVLVTAEGADGTRGEVYGWTRAAWGSEPVFTITGVVVGGYLGAQVTSGYDHDGDGVGDILATAQLDSRIATNAGSAVLFLDAPVGAVSAADADIEFTSTYGGALLSVTAIGDADGDGLGDLGLSQRMDASAGPGGLLVSGGRGTGVHDVSEASFAQLHGGPMVFGEVWAPYGDGTRELLAASGGISRYDLPVSGALTPWDDATDTLGFIDSDDYAGWIRTDVGDFASHAAFVVGSWTHGGGRGMVAAEHVYWEEGHSLDDAPFVASGVAAGDLLGSGLALHDVDADGVLDLLVGAPGADLGAVGGGALYVLPGPR